ncbi:MFS transporter [Paenisporosarcina cavernae]|uniref:MFS transporter n=1 Tax=Paenisporosarcina cavernae TaxID=2320858 RepID=A0A385YQM1_9BACL|nr:MFS transporter [Paenisporosarcina cavernae]AYC28670.1 MFS transporter [Paenisporosarcina cavernae]
MTIQRYYYALTSSRALLIQMVFTLNAIYYVSNAGLNPLELVLIGTIMEVSVLLFEMPTGLFADHFGRKKSLVLGTLILGVAHVVEGSTPEFWAIALASALWGFGWTFISGAEQAWIADELDGKDLERTFLRGAQFTSFARFLGIGVSVGVATLYSPQVSIIVAGALLIVVAGIAFWKVPETKFVPVDREAGDNGFLHMVKTLKTAANQVKGNTVLATIAFVTLFIGLASEGFDRLYGAHFIVDYNLEEEKAVVWFGVLYAVAFLLNMLLLKIVEVRVKHRLGTALMLINLLIVFTMIGFAWVGNVWIAVALYWMTSALRNVNYPLISVLTNERLESKGRATALSMIGQLDAFGQIAGGPLVGLLALYTSIAGGITSSAILILPVVYFLWKMNHAIKTSKTI